MRSTLGGEHPVRWTLEEPLHLARTHLHRVDLRERAGPRLRTGSREGLQGECDPGAIRGPEDGARAERPRSQRVLAKVQQHASTRAIRIDDPQDGPSARGFVRLRFRAFDIGHLAPIGRDGDAAPSQPVSVGAGGHHPPGPCQCVLAVPSRGADPQVLFADLKQPGPSAHTSGGRGFLSGEGFMGSPVGEQGWAPASSGEEQEQCGCSQPPSHL